MPRESKTSERMLAAIERSRQALELRKAGVTYPEIAHQLGYSRASGALAAVDSAIRRMLEEPAAAVLKLELARLDKMLFALWPEVLRGSPQHVAAALRVMDRRAKYLGLDAPTKIDIVEYTREYARNAGLSDADTEAAVREAELLTRGDR